MKSSRSPGKIQFLGEDRDIAIESKLDAGIHETSRMTRYAGSFPLEGRAVERVKELGASSAKILRRMS